MNIISEAELKFPGLFYSTETISADSQRAFLRVRIGELVALVLGGSVAEIPSSAIWGIGPTVAVLCFLVALALQLSGMSGRAEKKWYDGRAAAESIKSASWLFMTCGEAYRKSDKEAESRFVEFLAGVQSLLPHLDVPADDGTSAITDSMKAVRRSTKDVRRAAYISLRVDDQQRWYTRKAKWNKKRSLIWTLALVVTESIAILLGLARAFQWFDVDWLSIFAAIATSIGAWRQTKNFSSLREAYSVTSHEIQLVKTSLGGNSSEEEWSRLVHDAESAFSREHKLWLSRRQGPDSTK